MLQQKHTVPGHRRAAALQWALSAAVVLAVSAVLIAACGRSDASDPPDDASSTTEPERETTVLGCEVYPLDDLVEGTGSVTEGVTAVVPYCTDVKLIERECGIDSDSLRVPPVEEPIPGASTRVYLDAAGSPTAGS